MFVIELKYSFKYTSHYCGFLSGPKWSEFLISYFLKFEIVLRV